MSNNDPINHPTHYCQGGFEISDFINAWKLNWALGNVVKYVARAGKKSRHVLIDLKKAQWFLNKEIELMEKKK